MTRRLGCLLAQCVIALCVLALSSPSGAVSTSAAGAAQGERNAMPSAYAWLSRTAPVTSYSIAIVRGTTPPAALRAVGGARKNLGRLTPQQAAEYVIDNFDADEELLAVVQVQRLGQSVVLYEPYGFRPEFRLARLSANGVAASFATLDRKRKETKVAKRGDVVRSFSVLRQPPRRGALPEERGLDFGARGQNPFATGWAFNERLTLTHISQRWFAGRHPTYVVNGPAY